MTRLFYIHNTTINTLLQKSSMNTLGSLIFQ